MRSKVTNTWTERRARLEPAWFLHASLTAASDPRLSPGQRLSPNHQSRLHKVPEKDSITLCLLSYCNSEGGVEATILTQTTRKESSYQWCKMRSPPAPVLTTFYRSTAESIPTNCTSVWCGGRCPSADAPRQMPLWEHPCRTTRFCVPQASRL